MEKKTKIALIAAPILIAGWAAFRPELLFVNKTVNEKLPTQAGQMTEELAKGSFTSYAHETKGMASIVKVGSKNYLQLSKFETSNGPDVHVYLVSGSDASQDAVKNGKIIDLGGIKGNIGDQNYELPSDADPATYKAVSIWCKRFSVAFAGATLKDAMKPTASRISVPSSFQTLPAFFGGAIEVTFGQLKGDKHFAGRAAIIEEGGKRYLETNFSKAEGYELRLVKKESLSLGAFPNVPFVSLGKAMKGKHRVAISKDQDAWLYRSVAVVDGSGKIVASANLRSAQEKAAFIPGVYA